MGILAEPLAAIRGLHLPKGFRVVELGDQWITCVAPHRLAKAWYQELGCGAYVSIDGNGRGTYAWDLNRPLPVSLARFDLVTDFGTGEHVFNQAQVWRTLHELCTVGGHIIVDRPIAGYPGHGYYCVDSGLLDDLAEVNRYREVWRGTRKTDRGLLARRLWQRQTEAAFVVPQQRRYRSTLTI